MIILWIIPLLVMAFSGMSLLILRGRPLCLRSNAHQLAVMGLSASAVFSLARWHVPQIEIVLMAWASAVVVVLSVTREVARRGGI